MVTHLCYSDFEDILPAIDGLKGASLLAHSPSPIPFMSGILKILRQCCQSDGGAVHPPHPPLPPPPSPSHTTHARTMP